jgi:hypothetical protein
VAYECLAGTPPFVGEPPDVARAHRDHPLPPLPGSVPADVSALVVRLLAKDPAGRPGSAAEIAQQAGRLRKDLQDDPGIGPGRAPYPLAVAAVAQPPPPAAAPAAAADDAQRQAPASPWPASRAPAHDRRRIRRPVLVLASVAMAGLIGMMLAVTVGVALVRHLAGAPSSAQPGHAASGTIAGPPARRPPSASPSRSARPGTSPGATGTVPVAVSNHRANTGPVTSREKIHRHRDGNDTGRGHGHGNGQGNGNGDGNGGGHGNGNGNGHGNGNGNGHGNGNGNGGGNGQGNGNAQVLNISS